MSLSMKGVTLFARVLFALLSNLNIYSVTIGVDVRDSNESNDGSASIKTYMLFYSP